MALNYIDPDAPVVVNTVSPAQAAQVTQPNFSGTPVVPGPVQTTYVTAQEADNPGIL